MRDVRTTHTIAALEMALLQRQPDAALIHHSDQDSQYTAREYQQLFKDWGIQASMNGAGTWYDDAPMGSFLGTLKGEWVHHHVYRTRDEARADLLYYIFVSNYCNVLLRMLAAGSPRTTYPRQSFRASQVVISCCSSYLS
jgi:transposase InsO family protein